MNQEYAAIALISALALGVLALLVHENSRISARSKRTFYQTYLLILAALAAEAAGLLLNGMPEGTRWLHALAKCADYVLTPLVAVCFVRQLSEDDQWTRRIILPVLIANALIQIASIFTGWTFYLDEQNYYHHGPLYFLYILVYLAALAAVIFGFIRYGRRFRRRNLGSMLAAGVLVAIGIALQELTGVRVGYLVLVLGSSLLFIHYTEFSQLQQDDDLHNQQRLLESDVLTGLYSRYAYNSILQAYDAKPSLPSNLVIFSVDINELKEINDSLGHQAGDELIQGAAACIRSVLGSYGRCYRTGGDEFIAILTASREQIPALEEKLTASAKAWHGKQLDRLAISYGIACVEDHPGVTIEKLIAAADAAMYRDKERYYSQPGKDRRRR